MGVNGAQRKRRNAVKYGRPPPVSETRQRSDITADHDRGSIGAISPGPSHWSWMLIEGGEKRVDDAGL
ncbi:hypothetical protein MHYP_G00218450 [Metynnis hypsauchen]